MIVPRGAVIGHHPDEDRRRHTVSEGGVVVVTIDEQPLIGPIDAPSLRQEADADGNGMPA